MYLFFDTESTDMADYRASFDLPPDESSLAY